MNKHTQNVIRDFKERKKENLSFIPTIETENEV